MGVLLSTYKSWDDPPSMKWNIKGWNFSRLSWRYISTPFFLFRRCAKISTTRRVNRWPDSRLLRELWNPSWKNILSTDLASQELKVWFWSWARKNKTCRLFFVFVSICWKSYYPVCFLFPYVGLVTTLIQRWGVGRWCNLMKNLSNKIFCFEQ